VDLDDGFADEGGGEEGVEGDAEVAAGDAREVEEGVGDGRAGEDGRETVFLHVVVYHYLCPLHERFALFAFQL
jgi:hypothetical protein